MPDFCWLGTFEQEGVARAKDKYLCRDRSFPHLVNRTRVRSLARHPLRFFSVDQFMNTYQVDGLQKGWNALAQGLERLFVGMTYTYGRTLFPG